MTPVARRLAALEARRPRNPGRVADSLISSLDQIDGDPDLEPDDIDDEHDGAEEEQA